MRTIRLLSTIAATLLLGAGTAAAQGVNGAVKPEQPPAALKNAPAEKIAPSMHAGERGKAETTGQGSAQMLKPGTGGNAELNQRGTVGASPQSDDKSGAKAGVKADADVKGETGSQSGSTELKGESASKAQTSSSSTESATQKSGQVSKSDTIGQGAAAGAAKLSTEQRSKITAVIRKQKVEPAKLNISVNIGTHIPASVHYYPLPVEVVEVYPEWRGYNYILVDDQIVIIDPDTRAVVFILEA